MALAIPRILMTNRNSTLAWDYHNSTKHSYISIRSSPHFLDWDNQPLPFKVYPDIQPVPLPRAIDPTGVAALDAIIDADADATAKLNLMSLASILYYSAGVTKKKSHANGELYLRAAACAGALYPIETYVVCREIEGLAAGVYHFSPGDFSLRLLREGDYRSALVAATAGEPSISAAPAIFAYTAMSWRSSWKYRDRAYRYHYWDLGMILANALAMARGHRVKSKVVTGFVESDVNHLVGIDGKFE